MEWIYTLICGVNMMQVIIGGFLGGMLGFLLAKLGFTFLSLEFWCIVILYNGAIILSASLGD